MRKTYVFIGETLRNLRNKHNLRQQDVADYLGVAYRSYIAYEYDEREPSLFNLMKLAKLYRTTTDKILRKDDSDGDASH